MAFSGLLALLDDIATIADDVATLTAMAAKKTAGVVTDDMAVTAQQTIGISRDREIPVVLAVAKGSFFNKAVLLTPGALALNALAPWTILPILVAGGSFLCYEGVEKVLHARRGKDEHPGEEPDPEDPAAFEAKRVKGAIRTDLILSAEIIAISLGQVAEAPFVTQAATLYAISILMTVGVYGLVGALVKLDDAGEALVKRGGKGEALGRFVVRATPRLLHAISIIGTVAMLMVGGHILLEGIKPIEHFVHGLVVHLPGPLAWVASLLADITVGGVAGLVLVGLVSTGIPKRVVGVFRRGG